MALSEQEKRAQQKAEATNLQSEIDKYINVAGKILEDKESQNIDIEEVVNGAFGKEGKSKKSEEYNNLVAKIKDELRKKSPQNAILNDKRNEVAAERVILRGLINHLRAMGIEVITDDEEAQRVLDKANEGGVRVREEDGNAKLQRERRTIFNSDLTAEEISSIQKHIESLDSNTDTSNGLYLQSGNFIYKFNTSLSQYADNRRDGHDGFEIIDKIDISKLSEEQQNRLNYVIENRGNINSVFGEQGTWNEERALLDSDGIATNRETARNNDRLDSETLQGESDRGRGNRDSKGNQGASEVDDNNVRYFHTQSGEAYGFTVGGKIYIDPKIATAETAIHEYTHLWASAMKKKDPSEWERIVGIMKGNKLWDEIKKQYPELKTDSDLADEVLAHYSGKEGYDKLKAFVQREVLAGRKSAADEADVMKALKSIKNSIDQFWEWVGDLLGLQHDNAEQIADHVMRDLVDGFNPNQVTNGVDYQRRNHLIGEGGAKGLDRAEERTFRLDNLKVARQMEAEDKKPTEIWAATGWERGGDGKWRYEIPDVKVRDKVANFEPNNNFYYLDDVVDPKSDLLVAYKPIKTGKNSWLGNRLNTLDIAFTLDGADGEYNPEYNIIYMPKRYLGDDGTIIQQPDDLCDFDLLLVHELQHVIQRIEGFAVGSSKDKFNGSKQKKEDSYLTTAGEIEAYNVMYRHDEDEAFHRKYKPYDSELSWEFQEKYEDLRRKDYIYLFDDDRPNGRYTIAEPEIWEEPNDEVRFSKVEQEEKGKEVFGDIERIAKLQTLLGLKDIDGKININQDEYTDEFRRIQERSYKLNGEEISSFHRGEKQLTEVEQRKLGDVYERLLARRSGTRDNVWTDLNGKGNLFKITQVNGSLFHDIFEINRNYLQNGELVDLHDDYDNCKCFLSDDGLCGFAIENDGNLVSVFSLNPAKLENKRGFLYAIRNFAKEHGATHLDAYVSNKQNLEEIYKKTLGFYTASEMGFNDEYDHDDIGKNHGNPNVVFMVDHDVDRKYFDKNQYDEALAYQKDNDITRKQLEDEYKKLTTKDQTQREDEDTRTSDEESAGDIPEPPIRYSLVTDPNKIEELEQGEKLKTYRSMSLIDGKLYPPMSTKDNSTGKLRPAIELGKWEQAEENPENAKWNEKKQGWYFDLKQGRESSNSGANRTTNAVAYNPYLHSSRSPFNDQFTAAYDKNIVVVEVEIPKSELNGEYKADKAHDPVGERDWHAGTVSAALGRMGKPRKVILSRYDKPIRIVPEREVAQMIAKELKGTGLAMPFATVTPAMRQPLVDAGVKIEAPAPTATGEALHRAYNDWIKTQPQDDGIRFSRTPKQSTDPAIEYLNQLWDNGAPAQQSNSRRSRRVKPEVKSKDAATQILQGLAGHYTWDESNTLSDEEQKAWRGIRTHMGRSQQKAAKEGREQAAREARQSYSAQVQYEAALRGCTVPINNDKHSFLRDEHKEPDIWDIYKPCDC